MELPVQSVATARTFYADAFGFEMTEFGPTYACTMDGTTDLGLQADADEAAGAP